jgi:hypothetical protein
VSNQDGSGIAEDRPSSRGEQVDPPASHRFELLDSFPQRSVQVCEAGGCSVEGDFQSGVGVRTTAI